MTETEEHPTSELPAYVRGELDGDAAREVTEHLEECEECAEEERGLRLLTRDDADELNDLERARLHHAVIAAAAEAAAPVRAAPLGRRLAPYLGTAAVLVLLAVGVMVAGPGGDGEGLRSADMDAGAEMEGPEAPAEVGRDAVTQETQFGSVEGAASDAGAAGTAGGPTPDFELTAGRMAADDLDRLGRSARPFRAFAEAYRADAAPALQGPALEQLVADLPEDEADIVRACARHVLRTSAHAPIPVYGGYGSLDGQEVLLLGFAWAPGTSGPLDRFMIWAWPRGSCESPLVYRFGWIDR